MGERGVRNAEVRGSIPLCSTRRTNVKERFSPKRENRSLLLRRGALLAQSEVGMKIAPAVQVFTAPQKSLQARLRSLAIASM